MKVSGAGDPHRPWFPVRLPSDTHVQGLLRFGVGGAEGYFCSHL